MAVNKQGKSAGMTIAVGANVVTMIVLALALVVGVQWIAYHYSTRTDLTSSGVNSLSPATLNVLKGLDSNVRITSLYFKTDIEEEDQARYRSRIADLLQLYQATNRSKIEVEMINPLQDFERRQELLQRFARLPKFEEQAAGHRKAIEVFQEEVAPRLTDLLAAELAQIEALGALGGEDAQLVGQVRQLYGKVQTGLRSTTQALADAQAAAVPAYTAASQSIQQTYANVTGLLKSVTSVGDQVSGAVQQFSPAVQAFFSGAKERYGAILAQMEAQQAELQALPELDQEAVLQELTQDAGNALVVEAGGSATAVSFGAIWPSMDPGAPARGFADRKFLGEQKLTSAILGLLHTEKPAVVFVRHGGSPLFMGGFMPGMPPAVMAEMKAVLEDANFSVHEWDLATQEELPKIEPAPTRTIFVVLRPTPSRQNPFSQGPQEPQFSPDKLEKLKKAMGENPRAVFLAGWMPMMGGVPAPYELGEYLKAEWGIEAPSDRLVISTEQVEPGKFAIVSDPVTVVDAILAQHPITESLAKVITGFPYVAPLQLTPTPPAGTKVERLAWLEADEGTWSVSDVAFYAQQMRNPFIVPSAGDYEGEFTVAALSTKGEGRIAVIGATDFVADRVAFEPIAVRVGGGIAVRYRYPGNAALFVNTLHWLNDNVEWINLGSPVDQSTIAIDPRSGSMRGVQAAVAAAPLAAMLCGVGVWRVRRR